MKIKLLGNKFLKTFILSNSSYMLVKLRWIFYENMLIGDYQLKLKIENTND